MPANQGKHCPLNRGFQRLPSTPKVVDFVPQLELLKRAAFTITHGAGVAQLRYGDDGYPDRLRPARRARLGGMKRERHSVTNVLRHPSGVERSLLSA